MALMGFGNIVHGQAVKGLIYLAIEVAYIVFMAVNGAGFLSMLPSLGTVPQEEVWDEARQIYTYTEGDQSVLILLYGVATVLLTLLMSARGGSAAQRLQGGVPCKGGQARPIISGRTLRSLLHENLHRLLMTPPAVFILCLTVLPLILSNPAMAFTTTARSTIT